MRFRQSLLLMVPLVASAADVNMHVCRQVGEDTPVAVYSTIVGTTTNCCTKAAEKISGAIFTHWTISTEQTFKPRDAWGRAKDAADYVPYADTTLTAHYLLDTVDADGDGVSDGRELYWYGDLDETPAGDTDHDGYTFAEELAAGTNPLFPDVSLTHLDWDDSSSHLYNPLGYRKVTERSEPEGELFDTATRYVKPGECVTTVNTGNVVKTSFAYWTKNGVRQCDAWGRALDGLAFTMPNEDVELVAHSIWNETKRNQCYWYGDAAVALDSDLDHDGYTFAEEIAAGTNPYFADRPSTNYHGVVRAMGASVVYNRDNAHLCTFRSEPEGELFDTTAENVKAGKKITSPTCNRLKTNFAYWMTNGVRVADAWGRSVDQIVATMPAEPLDCVAVTIADETARMKAYWYGDAAIDLASDTDHDGYSLAEELEQGTNPHFPDLKRVAYAGIVKDDTATKQMNLQIYEDVTDVLVGGAYTAFFASAVAGTAGETFGANVAPAVVDWNGDGKRDLLVAYAGGLRLFLNVQANENPDLSEATASLPKALADAFASVTQPAIAAGTNSVYLSDLGGTIRKFDRTAGTWSDTTLTGRPGIFNSADWSAKQASAGLGLVHRWSFNGQPKGGEIDVEITSAMAECDSVGGQHASFVGAVTANGTAVTLAGGPKGSSYVSLGANVLPTDGSAVTLEMWVKEVSVQNGSRIFDFGNDSANHLSAAWSEAMYDLGREYHVAEVFEPQQDGTWTMTCYQQDATTGETLSTKTTNMGSGWSLATLGQNDCWLGHSQFGDNDANAAYNEVRVWAKALTEAELAANAVAGPDADLAFDASGVPASETLVVLAADGALAAEDGTTFTVDEALPDGRSLSFGDASGDGLADVLAGDDAGQIWYCKRTGEKAYTLQHKVWGGTFEGFAEGLSVAAVDWDNDGDLDALVGTADGRLMLLRDPAGGRPSNLSLAAGVDTVSLKWDSNAQSRIRGYYVYRSEHGADAWTRVDATSIPRYLDKPGAGTNFDYAVASVSRLYKTGNSRPITVESAKTDPVGVALGQVAFTWRPAAGFAGEDVTIDLAVDNARNLSARNLQLRVSFDPAVLVPVEVKKSGLTEDLEIVETRASGSWLVAGAGGEIHAGAGTFLSFVFAVADGARLADASVKIEEFSLKSTGTRNAVPSVLRETGAITVGETTDGDAATVVAGSLGDLDGDGTLGWNDAELFLKWKDANQSDIPKSVRAAGDYNGDGVMDNRDYILMKRHFRTCEQKSKNGRMKGWNDKHNYKGK